MKKFRAGAADLQKAKRRGKRPSLPFVYSDEVWTGIEYQVAASLIYSGFIDEGLTLVRAVRERHSGFNRNPWDEFECGHHYARAMASWAVLLALSGYHYDGIVHSLSFSPRIRKKDFSTFWSAGTGWGNFRIRGRNVLLKVAYGNLRLSSLGLSSGLNFRRLRSIKLNTEKKRPSLWKRKGFCASLLKRLWNSRGEMSSRLSSKSTFTDSCFYKTGVLL
ncbi:MAG: GH116 family glycosyl hydrolase [Candidatus Aminicenantales bacterium]